MKKTALKPGKGFKPRSKKPMRRAAPLAVVSKTGQSRRLVQKKAYKLAADAGQQWCEACGTPGHTDHAHLLTQKQRPDLANNPLNWIRLCRGCHSLQEDNKAAFAARFPKVWALIQDRILQVGGVQALAFFQLKNPFKPIKT